MGVIPVTRRRYRFSDLLQTDPIPSAPFSTAKSDRRRSRSLVSPCSLFENLVLVSHSSDARCLHRTGVMCPITLHTRTARVTIQHKKPPPLPVNFVDILCSASAKRFVKRPHHEHGRAIISGGALFSVSWNNGQYSARRVSISWCFVGGIYFLRVATKM